ncbi:MAG TPA: N-acetylneuraminate synthase family protein [Spirochaetota bacterium]|nr:N-acetylneuraminate synthase family protein [Spirochaetota bacterium]
MLDAIIKNRRNAIYIAEIGLNHNGSPDTAVRMIEAAARAGADAVKFQTFVPELMSSVYTKDLMDAGFERQRDTGLVDFFRSFVFNREQYRVLQRAAEAEGLIFFTSVFDTASLEMMEGLDLPLYKLASSEVTNLPLVRAVAATGKPLILSTGMSSEEEIAAAVDLYCGNGGTELVLLHCVSLYPTPAEAVNLARIPVLAKRFGLPVGFSDHTREATAPMLAAAMGARIFEKHFTIDRNHDCPDKDISCTPEEFAGIIGSVERAVTMTGSGAVAFGREEAATARGARRSLFARRFIPAGKAIDGDDLVALRPGVGIPPSDLALVVGKRSRVDVPEGYLIRKEHLQ